MLKDLIELKQETEEHVKRFDPKKVYLTDKFKQSFKGCLESNQNITFLDECSCSIYENNQGQVSYFPYQWYYLASIAVPFIREVMNYKKNLVTIFPNNDDFVFSLKNENVLDKHIKNSEFSQEDQKKLKDFVINKSSWGGHKGIERTDFYVSPTLSSLNLIAASSENLASIIVKNMIEREELFSSAQYMLENYQDLTPKVKNYKYLFRDWLSFQISNKGKNSKEYLKESAIKEYVSGVELIESTWNDNNADNILNFYEDPFKSMKIATLDNLNNSEKIIEANKENRKFPLTGLKHYYNFLQQIKKSQSGLNLIYFGAPGTGKSFQIQNFIHEHGIWGYSNCEQHPKVFRTTFHPEYSYTDFVGQIMPETTSCGKGKESSTKIEYKFQEGIFTSALESALNTPDKPTFLILEDLSRANVSSVFGDLFQLLDRDETGNSEYCIDNKLIASKVFKKISSQSKAIYLPNNLFILGTVNTNDQNVFVMDTAFKRRFDFEYVSTKLLTEGGKPINDYEFQLNGQKILWSDFYQKVNTFITNKEENGGLGLSEDKQLGQFFIKFKQQDDEYNKDQLLGKLLQFLWNDVQKATFSSNSLFDNSINNFSELYEKFKNNENVFSNEFIYTLS
ncbi:hypothetical protein DOK67_0002088 [Enterococcus sp. DIV0212c]|uniref:McrB family protein n=1 Tax=Enterococcus sp. DIV0212c TaxID=2230867 RepID=UPI001A9B8063|nr:AAA family ATPase [Enterococcus sp. DIV0212c]MBO1354734.1 AAA family ATPase [Enterococcus sp. DIV0212c]